MTWIYVGIALLVLIGLAFVWALMRAASYAEAVLPPKDGQ
jgi:hypothetical protein